MEKKPVEFSQVAHLYLGCQFTRPDCPHALTFDVSELHAMLLFKIDCKPILRPLKDMTDEECAELGFSKIKRNLRLFSENFTANQYAYLLSKSFDLFGLIESNQAIPQTK